MRYDALIFDMDGTIVHNMPAHNAAWQSVLVGAGVNFDMHEFARTMVGKKNDEIVRWSLAGQATEAEILALSKLKEDMYRETYGPLREPLQGLLAVLELGARLGLPMAVATAAPEDNRRFILDALDLRRHFTAIVGAEDVTNGKPDPEIFLKAAGLMGVDAHKCLVFEDGLPGLEAARRAGMDAVMLCTTHGVEDAVGLPHVVKAVQDYTELDLEELLRG